jgi:release factor glutamine methyltransferase
LKTDGLSGEGALPGVRELISAGVKRLNQAGVENAALDAEVILSHAIGISRTRLLTGDVVPSADATARYASFIARRARREPVGYILGYKEFYGIELETSPAVLIPRPETETLVDAAIEELGARPAARVLDLGTGSGAIAIAIAAHAPGASVVACEISPAALTVARRNAIRHGLENRITFRTADCFMVRDGGPEIGQFDLIVANPPYIAEPEFACLQPEITDWEPVLALTAGADGLDFYRRIAQQVTRHLAGEGRLIVEIGEHQAAPVAAILAAAGLAAADSYRDLAGIVRVLKLGR